MAYMAPELLLKTANSNAESDWWAFGCCLYELTTGSTPFYADQPRELFKNILHAPFIPTNTDAALDSLLEHLLDKQPASRAADSDVATCAFFRVDRLGRRRLQETDASDPAASTFVRRGFTGRFFTVRRRRLPAEEEFTDAETRHFRRRKRKSLREAVVGARDLPAREET